MIYILDKIKGELVETEIIPVTKKELPLKKDGWNFNWRKLSNIDSGIVYGLKRLNSPEQFEGLMLLKVQDDALIMEDLEIAPHNIGSKNKKYDYVAGCLIAFACRESLKLTSAYKGFLLFVAKTKLIKWYSEKYGAQIVFGQRMCVDDKAGDRLIKEYLERTK